MEHARDGLQKVVVDAIRRAPAAEAPILGWPLACGSAVAARTRAVSYSDGVLNVEVPDALWRNELVNLVPKYLAVLSQFAKVKRIEFVTVKDAGLGRNARVSNS
jgi:Dna[CI] antecedent DciA-like protein